ncbi:hypothetical protein DENSPDRAFT_695246 [Dentipellis sp. KUC8613]|nr:hypothetical protein DENSPDRAFT_695246 [Dentipellis sp. KUC8613]
MTGLDWARFSSMAGAVTVPALWNATVTVGKPGCCRHCQCDGRSSRPLHSTSNTRCPHLHSPRSPWYYVVRVSPPPYDISHLIAHTPHRTGLGAQSSGSASALSALFSVLALGVGTSNAPPAPPRFLRAATKGARAPTGMGARVCRRCCVLPLRRSPFRCGFRDLGWVVLSVGDAWYR